MPRTAESQERAVSLAVPRATVRMYVCCVHALVTCDFGAANEEMSSTTPRAPIMCARNGMRVCKCGSVAILLSQPATEVCLTAGWCSVVVTGACGCVVCIEKCARDVLSKVIEGPSACVGMVTVGACNHIECTKDECVHKSMVGERGNGGIAQAYSGPLLIDVCASYSAYINEPLCDGAVVGDAPSISVC